MGTLFYRGQQLGRNDINVFLTNASGHPINAAEITYAIYDNTTGLEVLVGPQRRTPVNASVGEYFANIVVPLDANLGSYRVRWTIREILGGPIQTALQEFNVADRESSTPSCHTAIQMELVRRMRILLRDGNPDRNYHFRPPTHEQTIDQFSRVFGYIWEDEELIECLDEGLDMIIAAPPRTFFQDVDHMVMLKSEWKTLLLTAAMSWAVQMLQNNWIADEFSIAPETEVRVILPDGMEVDIPIAELYDLCYNSKVESAIRSAFKAGLLRVRSVTRNRLVVKSEVTAVLKHASGEKDCVQVTLLDGKQVTVTTDHSLFSMSSGLLVAKLSGTLEQREFIAVVQGDSLDSKLIQDISVVPSRPFMYDLSVPGPENFVLANGILAHNSYSIGGVSLDLEKSSKYSDMKQSLIDQFTTQLERAKATVKIIRGLQQPRYGSGIRSSFGPYVGRGVLAPAKFLGVV